MNTKHNKLILNIWFNWWNMTIFIDHILYLNMINNSNLLPFMYFLYLSFFVLTILSSFSSRYPSFVSNLNFFFFCFIKMYAAFAYYNNSFPNQTIALSVLKLLFTYSNYLENRIFKKLKTKTRLICGRAQILWKYFHVCPLPNCLSRF